MNQVEYQGPTVLELPLHLSMSWHFLLDVCELIFFVGGKNCSNYSKNIRRYCIKFNCQGNQAHGGTPAQSWPRSLDQGSISD